MRDTNRNYILEAFNFLWGKDKERLHWRRYALGATASVAACFAIAAAYMLLLPKTYTSEWSVILPGAGSDTRLSLDRIGQAQSSASSPFSDKALSPKVNYKEIAESRPVIEAAAKTVGLTAQDFGKPKIKLVDQASIIQFEITARSPEDARTRSWALFEAFKQRLDALRLDEVHSKNISLRASISDVEIGLKTARQKLLDLQTQSGLASIEQYNQLVSSIETLRRDQAITRATVAEKRSAFEAVRRELDLGQREAADLLRLSADPELREISASYAKASAAYAEVETRFKSGHPRVVDARGKLDSIKDALSAKLGTHPQVQTAKLDALPLDNERVLTLMASLIEKAAESAGQEARLAEIDRIMADVEDRRAKLGAVAAHLDDLQRNHMIANAVFSSALARLDASKSDQYASYPLAQMLSEPTLPERPSSPRLLFAAIAAFGGSALSCFGWLFAYLHQWFLFKRRKNRRDAKSLPPDLFPQAAI